MTTSLKTEVQNKIASVCGAGTFYPISYSGKTASVSTTAKAPASVVVNEISGTPTRSVRNGARGPYWSMANWIFEARIAFDCEVESSKFLTEELKSIHFTYNNESRVVCVPSFQTSEPPRQGAHNGTELVITFNVNTRR